MTADQNRLRERWRSLVEAVQEECGNCQDPGVLAEDEKQLKVSLPGSGIGERLAKTFTEDEVLNGDHGQLAWDFYQSYRSEREES